jgi:GNAT superfamily N-acetyltransferase
LTALAIRRAAADAVPAIVSLVNRAFEVEAFFVEKDRTNAAEVAEMLTRGVFLLAEAKGALAGCVLVEVRGQRGYFGLLSVEPARQGEGIGRALVEAAEDHCRRAGCAAMDIRVVDLRKELPPFYRRLGYEETGTEPFPEPEITKLPCRFVVMSKPL